MNAERLAELRKSIDSEEYTSCLPKTVRELLDHIAGLEFANGVLDSAAKDAQAWQYEAQTAKDAYAELLEANRVTEAEGGAIAQLNGMIDELRAQLEAQRGGAELRGLTDDEAQEIADQFGIETTKYTVFRIWGIAQSKVQRGGAVVVADRELEAEMEQLQTILSLEEDSAKGGYGFDYRRVVPKVRRVLELFRRIQPIPASQVLQPGMVGVDREELMYLHAFEKYARKHGPESIQDVAGTLDHLRSAQQAKGE